MNILVSQKIIYLGTCLKIAIVTLYVYEKDSHVRPDPNTCTTVLERIWFVGKELISYPKLNGLDLIFYVNQG